MLATSSKILDSKNICTFWVVTPQSMVWMQFVPFWDPHNFSLEYPTGLKVSYLESRARNSLELMIFIVLGGLV